MHSCILACGMTPLKKVLTPQFFFTPLACAAAAAAAAAAALISSFTQKKYYVPHEDLQGATNNRYLREYIIHRSVSQIVVLGWFLN